MWTRADLKARAWHTLRTSYWKGFLASIILLVITGSCSYRASTGGGKGSDLGLSQMGAAELIFVLVFVGIAFLIFFVVWLAWRFLLCAPFEVGVRQYFKQAAQGDDDLRHLVYAFGGSRYMTIVRAMLWRALWSFLWFLALVIPYFVKSYAYSMVPYILADDPQVGAKRALKISMQLTRGHKWRMFVLDLSFIGWYLLGLLALLVGIVFVLPYVNATKAELYLELRSRYSGGGRLADEIPGPLGPVGPPGPPEWA
ncbi:DUF975 family protein [Paenibacillus athensensis]|nr:DUF975 family protein [Paenibacillus athensensis]MCD1257619.1 DUF975 family protein [Paenibacillus athensensis]